jgi:hypothetical protein
MRFAAIVLSVASIAASASAQPRARALEEIRSAERTAEILGYAIAVPLGVTGAATGCAGLAMATHGNHYGGVPHGTFEGLLVVTAVASGLGLVLGLVSAGLSIDARSRRTRLFRAGTALSFAF